ncbi:hypothetical protein [Thalassococcus sp. BH17M4-6]|uniref:hypothetical protein n=1 Tax=Thalassococcus sp. BH17M4-6 TaxID=3413148 RepID=UPI003BF59B99
MASNNGNTRLKNNTSSGQANHKTAFKRVAAGSVRVIPSDMTSTGDTAMNRQIPNHRLRHDGSIDTAYYMARGRRLRSEAAHRMVGHDIQDSPARARPRQTGLFGMLFS